MTFCVSHDTPLVPEALFDLAIGIGDYRPTRGSHISALDPFWDQARPLAYGAAGNYVIPRMIPHDSHRPEVVAIYSHRKIVIRSSIGREAPKYPVYREISALTALSLSVEEGHPREDYEFLIGAPIHFPHGLVQQYAQMHHAIDLFDYLSLGMQLGVLSSAEIREFTLDTSFVPGGCELGIYPTAWLCNTLDKLEIIGREFVTRFAHRIRTYDSYQVRAVGFLAERLGSYFLLNELRRRWPQGIPRALFGCLCVLVPEGASYTGATVETAADQ
jgi:hypothetical protein